MSDINETTRLLHALGNGDAAVTPELFQLVHDELRRLAGNQFRQQRPDHTLQPTALVNEAFLKLVDQARTDWRSRAHFVAVAAKAMRQILIDHARGRARQKRGGNVCRVTMDEAITPIVDADPEILDLDEALKKLSEFDPRQSRIVELRFFGGMSVADIAHVLELSKTTVESEWR
ncbi:MAG: sigma-70 family RNA polymerase sigma factor, partial [Phycisphaerae bacterium]|nr:sigma-70 family RNA polymerase sigma factor [Phycisphaerae bacterium]